MTLLCSSSFLTTQIRRMSWLPCTKNNLVSFPHSHEMNIRHDDEMNENCIKLHKKSHESLWLKRGCWLFWVIFLVIGWTYANVFWPFSTANSCWYHLCSYFLKYVFFFFYLAVEDSVSSHASWHLWLPLNEVVYTGGDRGTSLSLWEKDKWWYCIIICLSSCVCV